MILKVAPKLLVEGWKPRRGTMITKQLVLAGCAAIVLSIATAQAGPCNTGKSAQDAGAGSTPGNTGQTIGTGSANSSQPPSTATMNRATGDVASSTQDAQKQMQGQPTTAPLAQGAEPSAKMTDRDQPTAAQQTQEGAEPSAKMADQDC
jgi:hypothetical protein